jgi:hypothetical protein
MAIPNLDDTKEQTDSVEPNPSDSGEVVIIVADPEIDEVILEPIEQ